ncbi:double-strand break repair protein MRE11 [Scaptodrosophila lebanonensis]|uniref:Double-strand break repair protein n=1 Tax=Drosophila lebanonensis TaxID=7225 RepID=A0A6J2T4F9_DROLE|nr:double-strand break repair protein MRE11 [Scaptodrosophila lebanonensis]
MADADSDNVIRVLVATDNHLGYAEKDPVRGTDSFTAFEEILELAVSEDVDMILLGGDLFHDSVPSQNSMHRCIELLRRYTFGDKPVSLEVLSDQTLSFHNTINQTVNYEDPNLNISIPVFSIHGNHDDPSGFGRLSSLDLLSTSGLVNYFGRWTDLTKLEINPILLRKGETQLALYGLSHINDARLTRLFRDFKVTMNCPGTAEEEWFHLMVVHQNRADRGPKNYLPEELLPAFLHMIIWGHEHDCRIVPELNVKRDFYVTQPGSSVPTSLSEGESLKKHVGLLEIYKTKCQLKPLPLQTVRPFIFEAINLADYEEELELKEGDAATRAYSFARERVEAMIVRAMELRTGHPKQPIVPLIRLRLMFTDESYMFNTIRFGQMFEGRVANVSDVVQFKKVVKKVKSDTLALDKEAMKRAFEKMEVENTARVEELVDRYFDEVKDKNPLKLMHSKALAEMTYRLVERVDGNAAENIVKFYREKAIEHLMETLPSDENVDNELANFRTRYKHDDLLKMLDARGAQAVPLKCNALKNESNIIVKGPTAVNRGRGRGRGAAGSSTSSRAKPQLNVSVNTTRSSGRNQSILNAASRSKNKVYLISDESDSDN